MAPHLLYGSLTAPTRNYRGMPKDRGRRDALCCETVGAWVVLAVRTGFAWRPLCGIISVTLRRTSSTIPSIRTIVSSSTWTRVTRSLVVHIEVVSCGIANGSTSHATEGVSRGTFLTGDAGASGDVV